MESTEKIKSWIAENAPALQGLYQNKYVGMVYDRFASLPPKQQKQLILGVFGGGVGLIALYIMISYFSLWSTSSKTTKSYEMVNMLLQYQKDRRDKGQEIQLLERNNALAGSGALKQALQDIARSSGISPKMAAIEEKGGASAESDDGKGATEVQGKEATIALQRINLTQLKNFLQNVEFGSYNILVSSIRISNDDKIRGYMKADLSVVAYLFKADEGL
jgi:hypothetical protein